MNNVIIIGMDHSNTLGVIRSFGENGIKPYVFIISDTNVVAIKHSKYICKTFICKDEEEAIFTMIQEFEDFKEKLVVIPTSDRAASILDSNYSKLSHKFILHNIANEENKINFYMDKYEQYNLAQENGVMTAKSQVLYYPFNDKIDNNIKFPIIIKPLISAEGKKTDISIAKESKDFDECLNKFREDKYKSIIIQEFIDFDYECDMSGFSFNNEISVCGYIKKNRIWPQKRGSLTFGQVKLTQKFDDQIKKITDLLKKIKYTGLFDIEFFVKNDKIYLNEINFRNSGLTYLYEESYICYYYYLSCMENKFISAPKIKDEYYIMDEQAEIHQILDKNITIKQHKKDKKSSKLLLVYNKKDPKPSKYMLLNKIINNLHLKKVLLLFEKGIHKNKITYLLKSDDENILSEHINNDYNIVELNSDTINLLPDFKKDIEKEYAKGNIDGIILIKNNEYIGRGLIKHMGANDRFASIKNKDSHLICNIHVYPKFRGKNYQCDIVLELIKKYIKTEKYNLYTVVYKYNIPSWKNFLKIGFYINKEFQIVRVLKKSINKEKI